MLGTNQALARTSTVLFCISTTLFATRADARRRAARTDVPEAPRTSCLVLEWMDPHELLPAGEQWMAQETLRVLDRADIGARWEWRRQREPGNASAVTHEHRLRVVLVPSEPSGPGWRLLPNTLGVTVVDKDGDEAPSAVYIFYNAVAASLGIGEPADHRLLARASRALGRVVAHEVAHAIVPHEPHASDGLMRARLDSRFLTSKGDVSIDARWKNALGQGLSELCSER